MTRTNDEDANVQRLLDHYKAGTDTLTWGYSDCAAGVAASLGIIPDRLKDDDLADALGIDYGEAQSLISGPRSIAWTRWDSAERRERVVALLEGVLRGEGVDWGVGGNRI